jgi:hypothetical protein
MSAVNPLRRFERNLRQSFAEFLRLESLYVNAAERETGLRLGASQTVSIFFSPSPNQSQIRRPRSLKRRR